jgi:hypothetical protein
MATATLTDFADAVQEQVTSGVKQAQDINLAAIEVVRDFAAIFQPSRGATVALPKMLELQHDYTVRMLEALTPVTVADRS